MPKQNCSVYSPCLVTLLLIPILSERKMKRNIAFIADKSLSKTHVTQFVAIHLNREVIMLIEFYMLAQWIFAPEAAAQAHSMLVA